jgi:predicted SnoaL-like aldol condensation-catalyzing enzyme
MKNSVLVVLLAVLVCFSFACQNKAEKAELEKYRTQAEIEAKNESLIYRWAEEINKRRSVDVIDDFIFADYIWHLPGLDIRGIEKIKESFGQSFANYPDFHLTAEDVVAKGDKVVARWTWQGTNKETGKKEVSANITIDRIANGKFVEGWELEAENGWAKDNK